jgi:lipopolysaccharide transport system ATP-binding protein
MIGSIQVTNLGKAYKQYPNRWSRLAEWVVPFRGARHQLKWALQDINFRVHPGEAVGIIGINGAGKSTLLKLITGTAQPTKGEAVATGRVAAMLELGMGFHPDFTGRQNVFMSGQLLGLSVEEIARLMPEIEAFAEIGDYIDQPVRVYSSGMQVRLAFAVATAVRPDILIVDEALAVGDAYFQAKCYERVAQYKNQGTTLLLVTHSVGDIVKHCNRALFIQNGTLTKDGDAREVTNLYLDALFGKPGSIKPNVDDLASNDGATMGLGIEDVFHTRPGYRKEEYRWGQGGAVILDYLIVSQGQHYPGQIESAQITDFYFKVRFDRHFDTVVPGFLIKTLEGIFLYGTNSFISTNGREVIAAEPGDVVVFKFSLPMTLNEGHYLVSFGISSGDPLQLLTPLERRYDAVIIYITRPMPFWGITDLGALFNVTEQVSHE